MSRTRLDRKAYALIRARGGTQREALKAAGSKAGKTSISSVAGELERSADVAALMQEIRFRDRADRIADHAALREKMDEELQRIAFKSSNQDTQLRGLKQLAEFHGFDAPSQVEVGELATAMDLVDEADTGVSPDAPWRLGAKGTAMDLVEDLEEDAA